jgi:hypothetical protein
MIEAARQADVWRFVQMNIAIAEVGFSLPYFRAEAMVEEALA